MTRFIHTLCLLLLALAPYRATAQDFEFQPPATAGDPATSNAVRDLAERMLPVYQDTDIQQYLANLSLLQLAAGNYAAADDSRQSLRDRQHGTVPLSGPSLALDLYAHAKAQEAAAAVPLAQAFAQTFKDTAARLGDQDAYALIAWLRTPPAVPEGALQVAFDQMRGGARIEQQQALDLVRVYVSLQARRSLGPLLGPLAAEDQGRRYLSDDEALIRTPRGAQIHIRSVRPKGAARKRPALLEFALAPSLDDAAAAAAHGYVGVVAYSRSRAGGIVPFAHDGADARKVIRWIVRQPWSDGQVGMYGEGYAGFAAWAATKLPSPLQAIATADAMAPGIDFPAPGRVFRNSAYGLALRLERGSAGGGALDAAQMRALDQKWYRSGKPYRSFDRVAGARSPLFREWLTHPSYDRYWQKMIPFGEQFAQVGIPVLSMTGYYADGADGALYYFRRHQQYRPGGEHRLLLGPYDERALPDGPSPLLKGQGVDATALVDLRELRFQWFDHVFRKAALPPLLQDRVNFEVAGANQWRHAASLDAMAGATRRFYLDPAGAGTRHILAATQPPADGYAEQTLHFAERGDAGEAAPVAGKAPAARNGQIFVSEPLQQASELSGQFSGQLDLHLNRMDLDLYVALYELRAGGDYLPLCQPYEFRASYAGDPVHRRLLRAGERQQLPFVSACIASRRLQAGSRLALVLGVNKRPDREINYGSGKNVSEESIADGRRPLKIRWYGDSYVDLPLRK
ncbi:MAG: CocE/NonD family hydrolase [Nevskia sp.]|nr:CocE/NonD family hydrolase [Nevskia sp.]